MRIGILGSGVVARTLAAGFLKHGHDVTVGTRDPGKLTDWRKQHPDARVGTNADAASSGEILALAVKGTAASEVLRLAGGANLDGKVIIDTTNPIADAPADHGVLRFFTSLDDSLMERPARIRLRTVREGVQFSWKRAHGESGAESRTAHDVHLRQRSGGQAHVKALLDQLGWETEDMGTVEAARAIEPLCILWCLPGFLRNEWTHAFKVLR